ncbi:hypothetical protein G6F63_011984 [Rhizopus arrhizus]|nr:hypothetical protein G6F63_011984 [Rhizopus arrhizus]
MSVAAAARKPDVKESTARTLWKKLQEDPDSFTLEKKTNSQNRPENKLQDEHKQSLIEFFNNNPNAYIQNAVDMLTNNLKQITCWPEAKANVDNIQSRYDWVVKWSNTDMDFSKNCVFIDEAGFDINLKPSRAWAPRGQMAVTTAPTTKAPSHTILNTIPSVGVINLSIRVPKQPPKTTAGHYMRFLRETLDILDKYHQMRGRYSQ